MDDLKSPSGNELEALRGNFHGFQSISINAQWRIGFRWHETNVYDLSSHRLQRHVFTLMNAFQTYYKTKLLQTRIFQCAVESRTALIEDIESYASPELNDAIEEAQNQLFAEPEKRVVFLEDQLEEVNLFGRLVFFVLI